jgi:hypothetical protein
MIEVSSRPRRTTYYLLGAAFAVAASSTAAILMDGTSGARAAGRTGGVLSTSTDRTHFPGTGLFFQPHDTSSGVPLAAPQMTAQQAYAAAFNGNAIPGSMQYEYGSITELPDTVAPSSTTPASDYVFHDRAVWAFWMSGWCLPETQLPSAAPSATPQANTNCTVWTFVNPQTGQVIRESETQP